LFFQPQEAFERALDVGQRADIDGADIRFVGAGRGLGVFQLEELTLQLQEESVHDIVSPGFVDGFGGARAHFRERAQGGVAGRGGHRITFAGM